MPLCFALLSPPSTPYRSQPCTSNFLAAGCGLNEVASRLKSRFLSVPLVFLSVPSVPLCFALLSPPSTPYRSQPCTSSFLAVGYGFNEIVFWRTLVPHEALAMLDVPFETDRCYGTSVRPPIARQNAEALGRPSRFDREF